MNPVDVAAIRGLLAAIDDAESPGVAAEAPVSEGPIAVAASGLWAGDAARRALTVDDLQAVLAREIQAHDPAQQIEVLERL